jgi:hypothetical protein
MCINGYSDSFVFVKELQKLKKNKKKLGKRGHNLLKMLICLQKIENLVNKTKTINELAYQSIYTSSSFLQTSVSCLE